MITSAGTPRSSALSKMKIRGLAASSQKFWILLAALSAVLAVGGKFADTTGSNWAHLIHRESGIPFALAFATRDLLSSFLLNEASKKAAAASESGISGPCWESTSSVSSSESSSSSSTLVFFLGGGGQAGIGVCTAVLQTGT